MTRPQREKLLLKILDRMEACGGHHALSLVQLRQIGERVLNDYRNYDFQVLSASVQLLPSHQIIVVPPADKTVNKPSPVSVETL